MFSLSSIEWAVLAESGRKGNDLYAVSCKCQSMQVSLCDLFWYSYDRTLCHFADASLCVSEPIKSDLKKNWGIQ